MLEIDLVKLANPEVGYLDLIRNPRLSSLLHDAIRNPVLDSLVRLSDRLLRSCCSTRVTAPLLGY